MPKCNCWCRLLGPGRPDDEAVGWVFGKDITYIRVEGVVKNLNLIYKCMISSDLPQSQSLLLLELVSVVILIDKYIVMHL